MEIFMTQEELDALMSEEVLDNLDEIDTDEITESSSTAATPEMPLDDKKEDGHILPLPATEEHKMVHQLDDVTKESEEKASEIFDIIEGISTELMDKEEDLNSVVELINSNIELFKTLSVKFPDVDAFKAQLEKNEEALNKANETIETLQNSGDAIINVMDIMQYQDIHRQKIERVINVMRALSNYMNSLFEGRIDDDKRVSSAQHLPGDDTEELASTDDIEALLAQFGSND
jgi:hypothetical protein